MSLTRIDCCFFRGTAASLDTSSYVALNPHRQAGSVVMAGAVAATGSIGGQVACRLSLEHFVDGVLEFCLNRDLAEDQSLVSSASAESRPMPRELSVEILEAAFKNANSSVYNFGHKLAAGGRLAASLTGLVVEEKLIAAGRVGSGGAYLFREGSLFPFFEKGSTEGRERLQEVYVGANSLVSVELASVEAHPQDAVLIFSSGLVNGKEKELEEFLKTLNFERGRPAEEIAARLFAQPEKEAFILLARLGPDTIYLSETVE